MLSKKELESSNGVLYLGSKSTKVNGWRSGHHFSLRKVRSHFIGYFFFFDRPIDIRKITPYFLTNESATEKGKNFLRKGALLFDLMFGNNYWHVRNRLIQFSLNSSDSANSCSRARLCANLKKESLKSGPRPHLRLPRPLKNSILQ